MSYLSSVTTKTEYGVVQVGSNILVTDGIVSIEQSVAPNASVTFGNVNVDGNLYSFGEQVVTSVTPSNGVGIVLSDVVTSGPDAAFTVTNSGVVEVTANVGIGLSGSTGNVVVTNTGVTKLTAGAGISVSGSTGNITISSYGADLINVYGTTTSYTATLSDEYIGVYSASAVTITLPTGVDGRVYYIKDEYGQGSGKITIQPQTGEQIDSKTNYVISVPYQCVSVVFRAGQWRII